MLRPHRAEDYITKITTVAPGGDCPLWHKFLRRVTDGNIELQRYLKRVAGYCLTGSTREDAIFFLYGTGANGKSVFMTTLAGIMGDYAQTAPIEMLTETHGERHPTDLARLRGARLVIVTETEEGRHWQEAKIKKMTGGEPIAARFMRQDFFEYMPEFNLMIAGNHKPHFRNVEEATRRRFHLIPFTVTIPEEERDVQLRDKLRAEWSGILAWAIEGTREWYKGGLQPPGAVLAATDEYLRDQDIIRQFLEECCHTADDGKLLHEGAEANKDLYAAWRSWAADAGVVIVEQKSFGKERWFRRQMEAKGCAVVRDPRTNTSVFDGISLTDAGHARAAAWIAASKGNQQRLPV